MKNFDLYDLIYLVNGRIVPVGETNIDNDRFENLKAMTRLVDRIVYDIKAVAEYSKRYEYSMNRAGEFAESFLRNLEVWEESIEGE